MDGYEPERIELEVTIIRKIIGRIEVMVLVALGLLVADMFIRWQVPSKDFFSLFWLTALPVHRTRCIF